MNQDLNLSGRRDGANHVSHHIAKPQVAIGPPQRSLGKLESAADLFDLRILRHDRIERRVEANDTPDAVRFGHGRGRRCLGTANQQNGNGENKQSFHILHLGQKTLSLSRRDSLHSRLNWNCFDKRTQASRPIFTNLSQAGLPAPRQICFSSHRTALFCNSK